MFWIEFIIPNDGKYFKLSDDIKFNMLACVFTELHTFYPDYPFPSFYVRASQTSRQFALHFRVIQSIGDVLD